MKKKANPKTVPKLKYRIFKKDGRTGKISEVFNSGVIDTSYLAKLKPRRVETCPHCWEKHACVAKKGTQE